MITYSKTIYNNRHKSSRAAGFDFVALISDNKKPKRRVSYVLTYNIYIYIYKLCIALDSNIK